MKQRHRVLTLLATLSAITYLDRVCISVAGPRIQNELALTAQDWGFVTGSFAIAYALFEIPSGYLADRLGARAMLSRIVIWWSLFTTATGFVSRLSSLVVVRFLFGAGEAGAYPTASTSVFRWFPPVERGRAFGVIFLSGQLGSAIAPLVIVPVQARFGWRTCFYLFGVLGVIWAAGWWRWYRNHPREKAGMTPQEMAEISPPSNEVSHAFPWRAIGANKSVWTIMGSTFAYLYSYYFFLFWLPTYMVRARGFSEASTTLSALVFMLGALGNLSGGFARDAAVRRWGPKRGPRVVCIAGLAIASAAVLVAMFTTNRYLALAWLVLCYYGITFQQPTVFSTCVDIGKRYAGAVAGCMNTAGAVGGLVSSFLFGYWVQRTGSYDLVFASMATILGVGAALWLVTDPTQPLEPKA